MGQVIILEETTKNPITLIGKVAGVCYNSNTENNEKNFKRGLECLATNHGRTLESVDVYMIIDGYSAKMVRELYTHIGGAPMRLQASTRYIDYANKGMGYIIPPTIKEGTNEYIKYCNTMKYIQEAAAQLEANGIPKEDASMLLPLGMTTKVMYKCNLRTLIDMSHQRMCARAFWEYRQFMRDLIIALNGLGEEWKHITINYFKPKCDILNSCPEKRGCGRKPSVEK